MGKYMDDEAVLVFNIQGYSIQDGPGVRTTIFLKGCPLKCLWCSNPESQTFCGDVLHTRSKCVKCFRCVNLCERGAITMPEDPYAEDAYPIVNHKLCADCDDHPCVKGCYESAFEDVGTLMTVDDLMERIEADAPFFRNSGGGVTLSGGEPLVHAEFCQALFEECKDNYVHTTIETTGYAPWEKIKPVLEYTDLVLYDIKHMDSEVHKDLTGVGNELILENLKKIVAETKASVIVRIPVIPGLNDSDENMHATAAFAREAGVGIVHILPYHRMGMGKYEGLCRKYHIDEDMESPSDERMEEIQKIFQSHQLKCGIGGNGLYS